jgi:thiol-disulfide isomerase/thioredoxin
MKLISFTAGLAFLATQTFALFEGVNLLNSDNWTNTVENDKENAWFVTFYADWCPYCKAFEPELSVAVAS